MNILITGGAGFIGINLAHHYLEQGHQVTIFDNLSRPGVQANLDWIKTTQHAAALSVVLGDVTKPADLEIAVKDKDVIFHEAGQTAVTTSLIDPRHDFEVNAGGTFNVLEAVRLHAKDAIVFFASTNKVYGNLGSLQLVEEANRYVPAGITTIDESQPLDFHSPYGCSKGTGDQYIHDYSRSFGLRTVVFRQSCIYGVHQFGVEDQGWVAHFAAQVVKKQPITIFGNGKQVRDLLYIDDLVHGYDAALNQIDTTAGNVYNMGGGIHNTTSLLEIITTLEKVTGQPIELKFQDERIGDQKYFVANTGKAKQDFGWEPTTGLADGLAKLYQWLVKYYQTQ